MISVLIPSTGRPTHLENTLDSLYHSTNSRSLIELVLVVEKDPTSTKVAREYLDRFGRVIIDCDTSRTDYQGSPAAWDRALSLCTGEFIVFAADDLTFHDGWLQEALKVMEEWFDKNGGLVGFNDGIWDGLELSTHYLMSRWFVVNILGGRISWPCYVHSFNDLETNDRAKDARRHAWAPRAAVTHNHWFVGTREQDDTDKRALKGYEASKLAYDNRRSNGWPQTYPPTITE